MKRLISLALVSALMLTLAPLSPGSHADEKRPTAEDFEFILVEEKVLEYGYFSEDLVAVKLSGGFGYRYWGYMDGSGKIVDMTNVFEEAYPFQGGLALVAKNVGGTKYGLIDKTGKVVLPIEYSKIKFLPKEDYNNSENLYRVEKDEKNAIVNSKGKLILKLIKENYVLQGEDRISFTKDGKTNLYDIKGNLINQGKYEISLDDKVINGHVMIRAFKGDRALVKYFSKDKDNYAYIDKFGNVISEGYDWATPYSEGLAIVAKDGKFFFIDVNGRMVFELSQEDYRVYSTYPYKGGLAAVYSNNSNNFGFIDKTGKLVIPCIYGEVYDDGFDYGYAWVSKKTFSSDEFALIDKSGRELLPFSYDPWYHANGYTEGLSRVRSLGKYGFINEKGEIQILPEYDVVSNFKDGLAWAKKDDEWFLIDKRGQKVFDDSFYDVCFQNNEDFGFELVFEKKIPRNPFLSGLTLVKRALKDGTKQLYIMRYKKYPGSMSQSKDKGYIYGEADKGEGLILPTDELANVTDKVTAAEALDKALAGATEEQKTSATGTDLLTLYGEEAALRVAKTEVEGSEFIIDKVGVEKLEKASIEAKAAVEGALKDGGVSVQRELSTGVVYEVKEGDKLSVKVDASSAEAKADNVRVETPTYSLSFNKKALASIKEQSAEPLEITVTELPAGSAESTDYKAENLSRNADLRAENPSQCADFSDGHSEIFSQIDQPSGSDFPRLMGTQIPSKAVGANLFEDAASKIFDIKFSKKMTEKVKLSLPVIKGNPNYQAVYDSTGKAIGGKYNPVTKKLDVKINKSDKYVVKEKKKSFADITSKSKEMQDAIEILASKGIIAGTSPTNFSPDGTITRAEIAALILRSISKLNPSENGGFSDVASTDWYFGAVGSAKRHGIMNGVSKTHFAPKKSILKDQIVAVAARVLKEEMGYLAPSGPEAFLGSYTDAASIPNWAKSDVALATREGLVVKRYDSAFIPASTMTRGDVAVILHRLFKKLW